MKVFRKLGFTHLETAEIVSTLNKLLANYQIHYQKLRCFHWTVKGADFFELHKVFEEEYNEVKLNIDAIAERIRVFGKRPLCTLASYIEVADIKEVDKPLTSYEMVKEILDDLENLLSYMIDVTDAAKGIGDTATDDMITGFVRRMEKRHWMLSAWAQQS